MGKRIRKRARKRKDITLDLGYEKTYRIETPEECNVLIGKVHGIGGRSKQQDSFGISDLKEEAIRERGILAVLADGMGGLADGERASMATVISCLNYFETHEGELDEQTMVSMAENANIEVKEVLGSSSGSSGSTLAAAHVKENELRWLSIGDSRIFLYRDGELTQISKDHNYAADLQAKVEAGDITLEEALCDPQKNALTSYIGIDILEKIDYSMEPLVLFEGDRIILMSDGVYNTLTEDEIIESMQFPLTRSMMHLGRLVEGKREKNQDNYTAIIMEIQEQIS